MSALWVRQSNGPKADIRRSNDRFPPDSGRAGYRGGIAVHSQERPSEAPQKIEHSSLTTLREKLVKIGARIVRHGRYVVLQLAEVAVPIRLRTLR